MRINDLNWLIGGAAGQGTMQASAILALALTRGGLYTHITSEFPSLIRGGHNYTYLRISDKPVLTHRTEVDMVLALNQETADLHIDEIVENGILICDDAITPKNAQNKIIIYKAPLRKIALEHGKNEIMANIAGLGVTLGLLDFDIKFLRDLLKEKFGKKGKLIAEGNIKALEASSEFAKKNHPEDFKYRLKSMKSKNPRLLLSGNDAVTIGAIRAGCKFVAEYPMTPSTSILHLMAEEARNFNIIVTHTEDEIAAVNMLAGAGFAGARAMTGTSGGGFSLMSEGIGLSVSAEIPMVIVDSQRGGPSTGLPTRTDQADLNLAYYTTQGDAPRFVIAPGNHEESFYLTFQAFNLAEKYQCPVIILNDKYLAESLATVEKFAYKNLKIDRGKIVHSPQKFKRYEITEDGVSPRAIPGQIGLIHRASGYEQNEYGEVSENAKNHADMMDKRARKLETALRELPSPPVYGPRDAEIGIISWGSAKGAILEALEILKRDGITANFMQIQFIQPLHAKEVKSFMQNRLIISIEGNQSGQLAQIIKKETLESPNFEILKYSGRPITQMETVNAIREIITGTPSPESNIRIITSHKDSHESRVTSHKKSDSIVNRNYRGISLQSASHKSPISHDS